MAIVLPSLLEMALCSMSVKMTVSPLLLDEVEHGDVVQLRGMLLVEGLNVGGESLTVAQSEGGGGAIGHFLGNQLDQRRFVHCFGVFNESISEQPFTSVS